MAREKTIRRIAAIDIGTNSIHMVIVECEGRSCRIIDRQKEMVQLGLGSLGGQPLQTAAMDRAVEALSRMTELARNHGAGRIVAVATSAVREAPNRAEFIRRANRQAGLRIRVISGEEEADLIFRAVRDAVDFEGSALGIDIGGGSVELILGTRTQIYFAASEPLGCLRLTQAWLRKDPPTRAEVQACQKHIRRTLRKSVSEIRDLGFDSCIGTSGTIMALADIAAGRDGGQAIAAGLHRVEVTALEETIETLRTMSVAERAEAFGLDQKRAATILAGALVLHQTLRLLKVEQLRACSAALREGIVARVLDRSSRRARDGSVREGAVRELARRSRYGKAHADHVAMLATRIFDQTTPLHGLGDEEREILEHAAVLHEIGLHISWKRHHKHSYYLIRHAGLKGFTNEQVAVLANVARYYRKSTPHEKHANFSELDETQRSVVKKLSSILRIAEGLDRAHKQSVRDVSVRKRGKFMRFEIAAPAGSDVELESAHKRSKYFSKIFSVRPSFVPEKSSEPRSRRTDAPSTSE
ncbi:MAG: Ppx/GppA phosphatase family protein [Acidobacteriota bacterium]